jgi:arylsulfatase A-like enzyme
MHNMLRHAGNGRPPVTDRSWFVWLVSLDMGLFFLFLELLKAYRSAQWSGTAFNDMLGALAGLLVYTAVIAFATSLLHTLIRRRFPHRPGSAILLPVCLFISSAAVWGVLSLFREYTPTLDDAIVLAGLAAVTGAFLVLPYTTGLTLSECATLIGTCLLSGITALFACGRLFIFAGNRADMFTLLPPLWMAAAALTGLLAWSLRRRPDFMPRILFAAAVIGIPLWACGHLCRAPETHERRPPNLIFIVSDSLRSESIRLYGGPVETPHIEKLAREGVLFEQSWSLAPWTMPSMSAMFSSAYPPGLTPDTQGDEWLLQLWQYEVKAREAGLAERLRNSGYATGAMTSNALLWTMPGMLAGFEEEGRAHPILLRRQSILNHCPFLQDTIAGLLPWTDCLRAHDTTRSMTEYSIAFLRRHRDKPFFLYVHYMDPHAPYDPPMRFRSEEKGPWPMFYPYAGGERWGVPQLTGDFAIAEEDRDYVASLYNGEIRYMDAGVGQLISELDRLGLRENTYICFTSDHGEELWEHGEWGHGQSVYNELVQVPLIFQGPDIRPNRIPGAVSAIDLLPTLADLTGCEADPGWRGRSLGPVLRGEAEDVPVEPVYAQGTSNKAWPYPYRMTAAGQYKLIEKAGADEFMLFNIEKDPGETENLIEEEPAAAGYLRKLMREWLDSFNSAFALPEAEDSAPEDRMEMHERLRGMGYL